MYNVQELAKLAQNTHCGQPVRVREASTATMRSSTHVCSCRVCGKYWDVRVPRQDQVKPVYVKRYI